MKKKGIVLIILLCILLGTLLVYKAVGGAMLRQKTYDFLEEKGYSKSDISDVEIRHSFLNKLLSYNEWRIFVTFQREPEVVFAFTYRNGEIIRQGVSSPGLLEKEEILAYEEMLDNGELKK